LTVRGVGVYNIIKAASHVFRAAARDLSISSAFHSPAARVRRRRRNKGGFAVDLREIMQQRRFVVVGDTLNEEKYAHKIKWGLIAKGYTVHCVGKELASINDVPGDIDVIDLCIHPAKGIGLLRACEKPFKCVVIQPGAESEEILRYLGENRLPYLEGCLLVGLSLYAGDGEAKGQA